MKKLFVAIHHDDLGTVQRLLEKDASLLTVVAKQPPKMDDGQSPLQVAVKDGHFAIAHYLLDLGADVNFMERESCNVWRAPVLHDAINAAVKSSRWNTVCPPQFGGFKVHNTAEEARRAFGLLERMVELGADVNSLDSYGNSCLIRACLSARQILPQYNYATHTIDTSRLLTPELEEDLERIFRLLMDQGADLDYIRPGVEKSIREFYQAEPVGCFLRNTRPSEEFRTRKED